MNPSHKRRAVKQAHYLLTKYPVLALIGPRQSGKTTLLKDEFPDHLYFTLEDPDTRQQAELDPKTFLTQNDGKLILDEVQKMPLLLSYIQGMVDDKKVMGQYLLSGSQNFMLMSNITQSLAGRVALLQLFPFDLDEMKDAGILPENQAQAAFTGFYPAIFDRDFSPNTFYSNYISTYIKKDVVDLANLHNTRQFINFLKLCASRAGSLVNFTEMGKACGVSHSTVMRWINLLETMFIVYQLPPYFENFDKRIVKSPKLYFYDTGLLCHLLNIKSTDQLSSHSNWGGIFENMIVSEFVKQGHHRALDQELYYFRDSNGNEVDLILPEADKFHIFEIKASTTFNSRFIEGLKKFEAFTGDRVKTKNLIMAGSDTFPMKVVNVRSWNNLDFWD